MNNKIDFQFEIEKIITSFDRICDLELWEHLIEVIKSGKKLRPTFVTLLWKYYLPNKNIPQELINDLIALELIHSSTLIHDDIIDKGLFRRNIATINHKSGDEVALLMGNLVKDWALKLSSQESILSLNSASFDVNLGQLWETLARKHKTISINHYIAIVLFKTSKIFSHTVDIFSLYSKIAFTNTEKNFIVAMAITYQIADDLLDYLNTNKKDKSVGQDKKNNVHSFMVASFNDTFDNLADKDGVQYTNEVYFIREYLNILKESYQIQSTFEELTAKKQQNFVKDLCSLMMNEARNKKLNNHFVEVLSIYFEKIKASILSMQIQ